MKRIIAAMLLLCTLAFTACENTDPVDTTSADTTVPVTEADTTAAETGIPENANYYVRTPEQPPEKADITYPVYEFKSYSEACNKAKTPEMANQGYAVYNEKGEFVFGFHNEYITNMMYLSKYIVDFARLNGYKYGSAQTNPAVTYNKYMSGETRKLSEKIVSCDRFVGWVLYEMGYVDQPRDSGMFVYGNSSNRDHNLMLYLDKHGYERIDRTTDFKAGDIVFVNPTSANGEPYGAHVFICAGPSTRGLFYRYDHGSDKRIQSVQPSNEAISNLFCVYRPTQTKMSDIPSDLKAPSGR